MAPRHGFHPFSFLKRSVSAAFIPSPVLDISLQFFILTGLCAL